MFQTLYVVHNGHKRTPKQLSWMHRQYMRHASCHAWCLICCSGTFMNSSWTHLMNVNESSLTIWFMNYLSSWPLWTKGEFMNRISSWTREFSWKSHLLFKNTLMNTLMKWTLIVFLFRNIHELFMNVHDVIISPRLRILRLYFTFVLISSLYICVCLMCLRVR